MCILSINIYLLSTVLSVENKLGIFDYGNELDMEI